MLTTSAIAASSASPTSGRASRIGSVIGSGVLAVPRDRPLEPLVELDLRLEAEQLAGLVDVRDAQLDVRVVERLEDELARARREALDALREVVDRHGGARVARR